MRTAGYGYNLTGDNKMVLTTISKTNKLNAIKEDYIDKIKKFGVGTSNTAPVSSQTSLQAPATDRLIKNIKSITTSTAGRVVVVGELLETEFNGKDIKEVALFDNNNQMQLRNTINTISKTNNIKVTITFTINYSVN